MSHKTSRRHFLALAAGAASAAGFTSASRSARAMSRPDDSAIPEQLKILVLGGTGQTGPAFIRQALAHGHQITIFNRGNRSDDMFPDVECLIGERDVAKPEGLDSLAAEVKKGREWDVVLDVWPHIPKLVEMTATLLQNNAKRYMFVSSVSVYEDSSQKNADESARVGEAPDADTTEFNWELFGPFKAECENRVRKLFPDERNAIFRPGLIVGPRDASFRGGYWPVRVRKGGEVLAPGDGETRIQNIDVRDLVAFELLCMERNIAGTFNIIGPHPRNPLTMRKLLETCKAVSKSDATFTWVPADFLEANEVGPWMQMPNWLPDDGEYAGFGTRSIDKAIAAGLTFRPLAETIEDTLQWFDALPDDARTSINNRAGIPPEKEAEVLAAWKARPTE